MSTTVTYNPRTQSLVWVYGTLRPGCGNDTMFGTYHDLGVVEMPGRLYWHDIGAFPVYVPQPGPERTKGNLLVVNDSDLKAVVMMELFAGYNAEWRTIELVGGESDERDVLTFPWRHSVSPDLLIESGDWYDVAWNVVHPRKRDAWNARR